ncbi:hypothetical protein CORC01_00482 [Colletotrichum orchidophilum]|uniref:Uncharacterized protein n=1 Tax=Colletotrichum orchidophilum TaxID=1209926 RepID=A0A1G4BRZ0_9PEZI|nr:uncharacterized protein CORC01_00482 [Colletotrichum orchidophilum]OHF04143.1 hypothetical protein CORC01_00482 [Colletotrichum orchidophilum]
MHPQLMILFAGPALGAPYLSLRDNDCGVIISSAAPITVTVVSPVQTVTASTNDGNTDPDNHHMAIPTGSSGAQPVSSSGVSETSHGASPFSNDPALPKGAPTVTLGLSNSSPPLPTAFATPLGKQSGVESQAASLFPSATTKPPNVTANTASPVSEESGGLGQSSPTLATTLTNAGDMESSPLATAPTTIIKGLSSTLTPESGNSAPLETESPLSTMTSNSSATAPSQTSQNVQSQTPVQVSSSTGSQTVLSFPVTRMFLVFILLVVEGFFIC